MNIIKRFLTPLFAQAWRNDTLARTPIPNPSYDPDRAAEWWSVRNGQPIDGDKRMRFPPTEKDQ